jgi:hypothetical protein
MLVLGGGEEDQREAAFLVLEAAHFDQAELVAVEVERGVDIRDADHGVKIAHLFAPAAALICAGT